MGRQEEGGGVGDGGGWGAISRLKHPFRLKEQCCTFSMEHKLIQSTREAKTASGAVLYPKQSY